MLRKPLDISKQNIPVHRKVKEVSERIKTFNSVKSVPERICTAYKIKTFGGKFVGTPISYFKGEEPVLNKWAPFLPMKTRKSVLNELAIVFLRLGSNSSSSY